MRRINYKSDIPPLLLSLKVDEKQITVPDCDFIVRFYIDGYEGRHYDCSHIGGVWSNCEPSEDGTKLVCYINNQRLGIGELCAEFHYISPDSRYSDGSQKSVVIIGSTELGVELVDDNGDAVTEAAIDVTLPFIYRTAYEIARDHGYTGTAEDFYSALASVVGIADAEKKRVTAEITRNANEQERIENEENRLNAENERVNAEAQRVRNEAIRGDAEGDRVEQEEDRKAKFQEITEFIATVRANEGNRESNEWERQANEDTRITEEAKRVEAEKKRAAEFEQQKLDLGGKIDRTDIINDLTTGGEGNALSAEMGKVLNETVILDSIDISFSISKYLNTSGVETSWYDGKCTDFYACNLGDVFAFTGAGSQSRVCAYDANKDFIKLLQSSGGTNITITINDSTIKYVRASGNVSDNTKSFSKINYKSIGHLRNDIDELNTELNDIIDDDITEGCVDGYYINHNGMIYTSSSFSYKEFEVRAGAVINYTCGAHPNIAAIAKKLTSSTFEELVPATSHVAQSFTYTATEDMTIAVSFNNGSDRSITIVTQNIESNRLNIENLLDAQSQLNQMFNAPDYGLLFDKVAVIGDSLTVGTLDAVSGDDAHAPGGSFGCSWLTCLAKKWGSRIRMHYGMGGSTCYSWLGSNGYGLGLMLKDTIIYDVYFIAYGHNDHGIFTVGTTSDTPTSVTINESNDVTMETEAANTTFLGNYKKIVNEIRIKAPNALIFMLCTDKKDSSSSGGIGYMNQYIKELAEWYYAQGDHRVFYVDYINSYVSKSGDNTGGHWSTFGYVNIALAINHALNKVIEEYMNTNALKAWGNYLESYRTTRNDQTRSGGY